MPPCRSLARPRFSPQAGLSLIETVIVLGVFALVVGGIWAAASIVNENARQYQASQQIQTIAQNVRQLYARVSDLSGYTPNQDITGTIEGQAAFPASMCLTAGCPTNAVNTDITNGWSGQVHVRAYTANATSFDIQYTGLPLKACIGLAAKLSGGDMVGLSVVTINNTPFSGIQLPLTVVTAGGACNNNSNNSVAWTFNLRTS